MIKKDCDLRMKLNHFFSKGLRFLLLFFLVNDKKIESMTDLFFEVYEVENLLEISLKCLTSPLQLVDHVSQHYFLMPKILFCLS